MSLFLDQRPLPSMMMATCFGNDFIFPFNLSACSYYLSICETHAPDLCANTGLISSQLHPYGQSLKQELRTFLGSFRLMKALHH
jgi:hypothetical protein